MVAWTNRARRSEAWRMRPRVKHLGRSNSDKIYVQLTNVVTQAQQPQGWGWQEGGVHALLHYDK